MKRFFVISLLPIIAVFISACSAYPNRETSEESLVSQLSEPSTESESSNSVLSSTAEDLSSEESTTESTKEETQMQLNIQIGDHLLTADLSDNSSARALLELLADGPITIDMSDYANMEKVGELPQSLPRNDEQINTDAGDLILYQGSSFVIYYDTNSWNLTRLGKINNATKQELRDILGSGSVTAVLSVSDQQ